MLITGNQLKAARALAGVDQLAVAQAAKVAVNTIRNMESRGQNPITSGAVTVRNVQSALEGLGVEFLNGERPGVRLKSFRLKDGGQSAFPIDNLLFYGFAAVDAGQTIIVRVEAPALERLNRSIQGDSDYLQTLEAHRGLIFKIAQTKYDRELDEPDHSGLGRYDDIAKLV